MVCQIIIVLQIKWVRDSFKVWKQRGGATREYRSCVPSGFNPTEWANVDTVRHNCYEDAYGYGGTFLVLSGLYNSIYNVTWQSGNFEMLCSDLLPKCIGDEWVG
jgi:hypothetical protein